MAYITSDLEGKEFWQSHFDQALEVGLDEFTEKIQAYLSQRRSLPGEGTSASQVFKYLVKVDQRHRINQQEFNLFLRRFGPFTNCLRKAALSFFNNGMLCTWFHGTISRHQAETLISAGPAGSFLVRFSEHHPTKFSLSYKKSDGKLRNTLLHNLPESGVGVEQGQGEFKQYPSVAHFVQENASLLCHPVESSLYRECMADADPAQDPSALPPPRSNQTQVNRYVSGQGSYYQPQAGFDASAYSAAGFGESYAPTGFGGSGPASGGAGNYGPAGFGNSGSDASSYGPAGFGPGGYAPAGFGDAGSGPAAGGSYFPAGFGEPSPFPNQGGYGSAFAGVGGRGSYEPSGFGAYTPPQPALGLSSSYDSEFEMPATNPGLGPYQPAFMTNSSDAKDGDPQDDFSTPPPMLALPSLERKSSRGLGGEPISRTISMQSAKEKFDRARNLIFTAATKPAQMGLVPEESPPSPDASNQEALVLLDEVLGLTQGKNEWHQQRLHCEALLMQGQLFSRLGDMSQALEALQTCLLALEETEDQHAGKPLDSSPSTSIAEQEVAMRNCCNRLRTLRFLTHEQLASIYHQQGNITKFINSYEELVGCAEDDSQRCNCLQNLRQVLGDQGMEQFNESEANRCLDEAARCFKAKDLDGAAAKYRQALGVARLGSLQATEARALGNLGTVNKALKNSTRAIRYYHQSIQLCRKLGDHQKERTMLNAISLACIEAERYTCAKKFCNELLSIMMDQENIKKIRERVKSIDKRMAQCPDTNT